MALWKRLSIVVRCTFLVGLLGCGRERHAVGVESAVASSTSVVATTDVPTAPKADLSFPLGISASTRPDTVPLPVQNHYEGDRGLQDLTVVFENRWEYQPSSGGDLTLGTTALWADELMFFRQDGQWQPGRLELVTTQVPDNPNESPSLAQCQSVQMTLTELAVYHEDKYKDANAVAPAVKGFFSGDCGVLKANDPQQRWSLRKKGMTVSVGATFEYRTGQLQVGVVYTTAAYEQMAKQSDAAQTKQRMSALEAVFASKPGLGLPFGHSTSLAPDALPWNVLDTETSPSGTLKTVLLAERTKDNIEVLGMPGFHPELVQFVRHQGKWQLLSFTLTADRLKNGSQYDCRVLTEYQQILAQAISNQHRDASASIETSSTYGSLDCKVLRYSEIRPRWALQRNGMEIAVVFRHQARSRRDYLDIVYTVTELRSIYQADLKASNR